MRNNPDAITLGIIGCGGVTETFHLPSLKSLRSIEVAALSDVDKEKLDRAAETFGIDKRYEDPYELIDSKEIDAVAVCTPSGSHFALGMAVLSAGKHLFMEKPVALSMEECGELINKAGESPAKAFAGFNQRFHRNVRKAKEIIENGGLGAVESVRTAMTVDDPGPAEWRKKRALGGGAVMDLAIHHFDLLRYLFGSEAEEVRASSLTGDIEDEEATVTLKLSNGIPASSVFSYRSGSRNYVEIYGHAGILRISLYDADGFEIKPNSAAAGGMISMIGGRLRKFAQAAGNAGTIKHGGIFKESYYSEWRSFADSVVHGKDAVCSLEDGSRALEIALAAIESASAGTPVKLPKPPYDLGKPSRT